MNRKSNRPAVAAMLLLAALPLLCLAVLAVALWGSPSGADVTVCAVWLPGTRGRAGLALGWYPYPLPPEPAYCEMCRSPAEWYTRLGLDLGDTLGGRCIVIPRPTWLSEEGAFLIP